MKQHLSWHVPWLGSSSCFFVSVIFILIAGKEKREGAVFVEMVDSLRFGTSDM